MRCLTLFFLFCVPLCYCSLYFVCFLCLLLLLFVFVFVDVIVCFSCVFVFDFVIVFCLLLCYCYCLWFMRFYVCCFISFVWICFGDVCERTCRSFGFIFYFVRFGSLILMVFQGGWLVILLLSSSCSSFSSSFISSFSSSCCSFLFYILLLRLLLLYCLYVCIHVCMFTSMCISPQKWVTHMYKMSNTWNLNYSDGNDNGFVINPITMIVVITLINSLVRRFCLYVSVRVITTILAIIVISKHYRYYVFFF